MNFGRKFFGSLQVHNGYLTFSLKTMHITILRSTSNHCISLIQTGKTVIASTTDQMRMNFHFSKVH